MSISAVKTALEHETGWMVYMIRADDQSLYTGITNNLLKRWKAHCNGAGARFFYGRKPDRLMYLETGHSRQSALKREYAIKQQTRQQKLHIIAQAEAQMRLTDDALDAVMAAPKP